MASRAGIRDFKSNRSGYVSIANSGPVQSLVAREAGYRQGNANAMIGHNVCRVGTANGKLAKGRVVSVSLGVASHAFDDAERRRSILASVLGGGR